MSCWRDRGAPGTPRNQTSDLARWQEDGQRFDRLQPGRVYVVQIFQQGIEAVSDFGQLRVLNLQAHRVAQTPHLLFGQFLHTSLPWLEGRNAPEAMVMCSGALTVAVSAPLPPQRARAPSLAHVARPGKAGREGPVGARSGWVETPPLARGERHHAWEAQVRRLHAVHLS